MHEFVRGNVRLLCGVVRMGADGAVHLVERFRDFKDLRKALHTCRDRHHAADTGTESAGDNRRPLLGEIRKIEMAMAVDEHQAFASGCST